MATRDKRIRSKNLSEEERDAQVAVTIRIPANIKSAIEEKAQQREVSQNVQFRDSLRLGLDLGLMVKQVRRCIVNTDPRFEDMAESREDTGEDTVRDPRYDLYREIGPTDAECLRFITNAVNRAVASQYREYEQMKQFEA